MRSADFLRCHFVRAEQPASSQSVRKEKPLARLFRQQRRTGLSVVKRAGNVEWAAEGHNQLSPRTVKGNNRAKGAVIFNLTGPPARLFIQRLQLTPASYSANTHRSSHLFSPGETAPVPAVSYIVSYELKTMCCPSLNDLSRPRGGLTHTLKSDQ